MPPTWYLDGDGDGFGNVDMEMVACEQPVGYIANNNDCDDNDATIGEPFTAYQDVSGLILALLSSQSVSLSTKPAG